MDNVALKGDLITRNPDGYLALATRAAELEREGRYIAALDMWKAAWKMAKNALNREWAKGRVNLCCTCIHRFGKREA